ncbi:MAG: endolytic transglycosylase MltG [Clostridia bacterium]|nr:endolytic transglycosylase MltG [Clostridia bacterium]
MKKNKYIRLLLIVILAVFLVSIIFDAAGIGGGKHPIDFKIAEGYGTNAIADGLKDAGIIANKTAFKIYARITGDHIYQKGTHTLNASMSFGKIINTLETIPEGRAHTVLIPEGYELRQIADTLETEGLINREVFMREVEVGNFDYDFLQGIESRQNRLEGYLYPDTYIFNENMSEYEIIDTMLANFERIVVPVYEQSQTDKSLDEIIKLASVVEREAANDDERSLVASVFVNRLNTGMRLESCATVQYLLRERKSVLSNEDTQIDSPYNTYKNSGLPIGPIASPGLKSIEAALYPEPTNYLYFMASKDGSYSLFAETFEEHCENQKRIQN